MARSSFWAPALAAANKRVGNILKKSDDAPLVEVQTSRLVEPAEQALQHESFRRHIDIAKRLGRTLVIHDREAHADILRILEEEGAPDRVVFHCFSGDAEMARYCAERGWYCSFAGVVITDCP